MATAALGSDGSGIEPSIHAAAISVQEKASSLNPTEGFGIMTTDKSITALAAYYTDVSGFTHLSTPDASPVPTSEAGVGLSLSDTFSPAAALYHAPAPAYSSDNYDDDDSEEEAEIATTDKAIPEAGVGTFLFNNFSPAAALSHAPAPAQKRTHSSDSDDSHDDSDSSKDESKTTSKRIKARKVVAVAAVAPALTQ